MPIDVKSLQFTVAGPYRHSDGSFKFSVVVLHASPIIGQPPDLAGTAEVWVKTDNVCRAMGEALRSIANQLPPELALPGARN
jgi:hypothetical protein